MLPNMDDYGEVVVTCLIVLVRVVFSLIDYRFMYEVLGLLCLSSAAFFTEVAVSRNNNLRLFNPRLDTSAGILMGAVCIPSVLVGRLVQRKRTASTWLDFNQLEDFKLHFWSSVTASIGLLVYIWVALSYRQSSMSIKRERKSWMIFAAVILFLAILLPVKVLNVAFLVSFSIWIMNHIIQVFPHCTSLGEAVLVSNGLAVYLSNAFAHVFDKTLFDGYSKDDSVPAILQGILIGLLCIPWLSKVVATGLTKFLVFCHFKQKNTKEKYHSAISFYIALFVASIITIGWLQYFSVLDKFFFTWVLEFVLQDIRRLYLCCFWAFVILMSAIPFYMVKSTKFEQIMVRKVFHVMVVVMFIPALTSQQTFLHLAFSIALAVFVVIEMIRIMRVPPLGEPVHRFMTAFTDARDSDLLILSHFSLLIGCALPVWLNGSTHDRPLARFAGVASVAGYNFGSMRLTQTSKKTVEGTITGIISMFLASIFIQCMLLSSSFTITELMSLTVAVIGTGLVEAYTTQLDNFILPLIFFTLLLV
ncbi:hypothetical protein KP509_27G034700 [Ceratopteris richardii]|uniref:dolichol kinase n=1 Tax=Ceratopteris richardii TaxID=49495 RepID=A0A8T2RFC0_CERRI|nr:hypothetical protein KP509_27G034700 [Ceratopteris richardii]